MNKRTVTTTLAALLAAASISACSPATEGAAPAPSPSAPAVSAPATPTPSATATKEAEPVEPASPAGLNDYTYGLYLRCLDDPYGDMTPADCEGVSRRVQANGVHDRASHNRWLAELAGEAEAAQEEEIYAIEGDTALDAEETDLVMNCPGDDVTEASSDCGGVDLPSDGE